MIVPETSGTVKTVDMGILGSSANVLIDGADVSVAGLIGKTGGPGESAFPLNVGGETIIYALGFTNFQELVAEFIIYIVTVE